MQTFHLHILRAEDELRSPLLEQARPDLLRPPRRGSTLTLSATPPRLASRHRRMLALDVKRDH